MLVNNFEIVLETELEKIILKVMKLKMKGERFFLFTFYLIDQPVATTLIQNFK